MLNALERNKKLQCQESLEDFEPKNLLNGIFDDTTILLDEYEKKGGKINEEIKNLIADGDLESALNILPNDNDVIIILKNQYAHLSQSKMIGSLTFNEVQLERTKITLALLQYLDEGNKMERMPRVHFN